MKTKTCIFTILLAVGLINSHAQDSWTRKADFGGIPRYGAVDFSIGGKGYIGTGNSNNGYQKDFWEYDPTIDAWTQKADFGGGIRQHAAGFAIGNKGYVGTGGDGPLRKDFWEYDPTTNIWTRKADFGGVSRFTAVGFSIGTKGYIGTGTSQSCCPLNALKDIWEYDPATDTWIQKADFGGGVRTYATGFSIGSKGYIGTGQDNDIVHKDFWEFDPTANTWSRKADFGGTARNAAMGLSIGGNGYIGTGDNVPGDKKDFWEYAPSTNSWTRKADFGGSARSWVRGFAIGSKGYVGTGAISNSNTFYKDFWEYTPATAQTRPITVTFNTNPAGLSYRVDGTTYNSARVFSWLSGSSHTISTTSPQNSGGHQYIWQSWSDNGAISHTIAPTTPTAYTAFFESSQPLFFPLADYQGLPIVELGPGSYTQEQLAAQGIANNSISSIRVPAGFKIEAFDSGDLTGTPVVISGDTPSLAARLFDNRLSSMRISRITVGATFYELCARQGYNVNLPVGNYDASALARWGIGDNQISQIIPVAGKEVEIFKDASFGGDSRLVRGSVCLADVGGGFDNATSSLRIRSSAIEFNDNFNDGSLDGWSVQEGTWSVQNGAMQGVGAADAWIYANPNLSFDGSIVLDADVNMVTGNARYVMNSTGLLRQTEYHIGIWSQDSPAYANRWQILRYDNFQISSPTSALPGAVDGNVPSSIPIPTRCHFTVRRVGGNFDVYINSIRIGSWTETTPLPALGKVGAGVVWDWTGTFDNFTVRH